MVTPNRIGNREAKRLGEAPLLFEELESARLPYTYERNFHHQLKARLLQEEIVTQIVRETTLMPGDFLRADGSPMRQLQDDATTA